MKIGLIIFLFCVGLCHQAIAQIEIKEWAPLGATWLYAKPTFSSEHKYMKVVHTKDTQIQKHIYKKFDVYYLLVQGYTSTTGRYEIRRYERYHDSYYIGIVGDTVFQPIANREIYYIDRNVIGEKVYPFRQCDPEDTTWFQLDSSYMKQLGEFKYKVKNYSTNFNLSGQTIEKDTMQELLPSKMGLPYGEFVSKISHFNVYYRGNKPCMQDFRLDTTGGYAYVLEWSLLACYDDPKAGRIGFEFVGCSDYTLSSMETISAMNIVEVFPNPASGKLNLSPASSLPISYILYNPLGNVVDSGIVIESSIDISHLTDGIYFVFLRNTSEDFVIKRFVKRQY